MEKGNLLPFVRHLQSRTLEALGEGISPHDVWDEGFLGRSHPKANAGNCYLLLQLKLGTQERGKVPLRALEEVQSSAPYP